MPQCTPNQQNNKKKSKKPYSLRLGKKHTSLKVGTNKLSDLKWVFENKLCSDKHAVCLCEQVP
jgi:hypothetical protein